MELSKIRTPIFLPRSKTRFIVGVDLGQSSDPTAISVLDHVSGVIDSGSDYERHINLTAKLQKPATRISVRYLERLPLGMSYPAVVQHIAELLAREPLCGNQNNRPAELVIDETGVGRAVGDIFVDVGMKPVRISITAGNEATWVGLDRWNVAKTILISNLDALLHTGELRIAPKLSEASTLKDELLDFRRHVGAAGRSTYAARTGRHDDLVLSVAIAAWWASRPPPAVARFGTYSWSDGIKLNPVDD